MCGCAGSLTERPGERPGRGYWFHPRAAGMNRATGERLIEEIRRLGSRWTAAWQDWVYEHAEAGGKPSAAHKFQGNRCVPVTIPARRSECPAGQAGATVENAPASGSPHQTTCPDIGSGHEPRFAAPLGRPACRRKSVIPPYTLHSCLCPAPLSAHAADPGNLSLPGGKVRWQKRFVFPARRMRRGLRF